MRAARKLSQGNIYHVIQRGTGRQIIFEDNQDRHSFLKGLNKALKEYGVELYCWCLMSNHFHLLLHGELPAISDVMKMCCGMYAMQFNGRHERVGHLFQERFKSEPINDDAYLLTVVRYIHQNPEKAGLCATDKWPWSSYWEYANPHNLRKLCETSFVLGCFDGVELFQAAHFNLCGDKDCMDVFGERSHTRAMSDERAIEVAGKVIGIGEIERIKAWEKRARNRGIKNLWEAGLSVRQIERLTGIGRGTINYALAGNAKNPAK